MDWDGTYRDLRRRNWIILLVLAAGSGCLAKVDVTLGIIAGGLAVILNFAVLQHTIQQAFTSGSAGKAKKASLLVKSYLRLLLLGITVYLLITRGLVDPIGLTVGLSTVVFSIVTFGIHRALTGSPSENEILRKLPENDHPGLLSGTKPGTRPGGWGLSQSEAKVKES